MKFHEKFGNLECLLHDPFEDIFNGMQILPAIGLECPLKSLEHFLNELKISSMCIQWAFNGHLIFVHVFLQHPVHTHQFSCVFSFFLLLGLARDHHPSPVWPSKRAFHHFFSTAFMLLHPTNIQHAIFLVHCRSPKRRFFFLV